MSADIPDFRGRPVGHLVLRGQATALPETRHIDAMMVAYRAAFAVLLGQDGTDGLVGFQLQRRLAGATGISVVLE